MQSKVKLLDDPVLRVACSPVNPLDMIFIQGLLDDMHAAMTAEEGLGLAANQIGYPVRVFILKEESGYTEYINPEIIEHSEPTKFLTEACLSIPGANAPVSRFRKLKLKWTTKDGSIKEDVFEDVRAFAVQHEIDHLDGKLYIDRLGPLQRKMVVTKHKKFLKLSKRDGE